jgi:hypothetical protein
LRPQPPRCHTGIVEREDLDDVLGITRCVRCGHRLQGEVECPVCTGYYASPGAGDALPRWIYFTACLLTSPLSIPFILRSPRLGPLEKAAAASGALIWAVLWLLW